LPKVHPRAFQNSDLVEQTVHEITGSDEYANANEEKTIDAHEMLFSTLDSSDAYIL
jgi:hypothetical protein